LDQQNQVSDSKGIGAANPLPGSVGSLNINSERFHGKPGSMNQQKSQRLMLSAQMQFLDPGTTNKTPKFDAQNQ